LAKETLKRASDAKAIQKKAAFMGEKDTRISGFVREAEKND